VAWLSSTTEPFRREPRSRPRSAGPSSLFPAGSKFAPTPPHDKSSAGGTRRKPARLYRRRASLVSRTFRHNPTPRRLASYTSTSDRTRPTSWRRAPSRTPMDTSGGVGVYVECRLFLKRELPCPGSADGRAAAFRHLTEVAGRAAIRSGARQRSGQRGQHRHPARKRR
jgi:hypothetical protein